jgi:O-antigen ligase
MNLLFILGAIGAFHSFFATYWLLIGSPSTTFVIKEFYLNAASGFFINRSNFSIFLLLCAFASLYFINFYIKSKNKKLSFIEQINSPIIYLRFFILFITIGIVLTFSRAGNFSYILMLNIIILSSFFTTKKFLNPVFNTVILILIIDIMFIGFYFGGSQLIDRYLILEDFKTSLDSTTNYTRMTMIIFGFEKFKEFLFFGYGFGGFEQVFKTYYTIIDGVYSNHVHNDIVELLGEFGIFGSIILLSLFIGYIIIIIKNVKCNKLTTLHPILISILFLTLLTNSMVDFSLHIPAVQYFLSTILAIGLTKFNNK